jgi:serine protease
MKRIIAVLQISLFLTFSVNAQTINPDYVDGVIYVKVYDSSTQQINFSSPGPDIAQIISDYSITSIEKPFMVPDQSVQNIYKVTCSDYNGVDNMISAFMALPYMEYAEKAPLIQLDYIPNDYNQNQQWSLQRINAPGAWGITTGSSAVKIAIVDNAVDYSHVDLAANAWTNPGEIAANGLDDDLNGYIDDIHGYDVSDRDNNPKPPPGTLNSSPFVHGTHCAGIASAVSDNNIGVASIAFRAKIISVKCAPDTATGARIRNAFEGIDYAISAGADVISMSFGSQTNSLTWQVLVNAAMLRNIVMVAAAGNDNNSTPFYPAATNYVIAVGATDQNDVRSTFSNYGSWIDVMAPGNSIYNTLPQNENTYGSLSGTSMACPLTAGLAGLVLSLNPNFTSSQVENYIKAGCDNINSQNPSYIGQIGTGRINALQTMLLITGLQETDSLKPFTVYPNPSNGNIFLQPYRNFDAPIKMDVYDHDGKLVSSQILGQMNRDGIVQIELSQELTPGEYSLIFNFNDKMIETEKIIITRPN